MMPSASDQSSILPQGAYDSSVPRKFGRLNDSGAPAWQFEPGLAVTHHLLFEEHSMPWWNPYQGFGTPWAAGMLSQPFYPLTVLASIHPSPRVVNWFVVIRLFVAGMLAFSFLRLFLGTMPSSIGGLAFMLTGYFAINLNLDNLSTDILAPLVLLGFEKLFRSSSARAWLWGIGSVWLVLISGMPESAFLMLTFGYCYFLFRVLTSPGTMTERWGLIRRLIICNVLAFAMSAFLLLPMVEFIQNGFDIHRGSPFGLISVRISRNILLYLLPLAEGPLYSARFAAMSGRMYGYLGVSCCILALTGGLSLFRSRSNRPKLILFFSVAVAVVIAKYFGLPPVQWIGYLPFFRLVNFPQYLQPILALSMAALCAFGADGLLRRELREEALLSIVALLCVAAILAVRCGLFVKPGAPEQQFFSYSLALGGVIAAALLMISLASSRWSRPRITFGALLLVMAAELSFNYLYPIYFYVQKLPQISADPYQGAPYVDYLKKRGIGLDRVFGRRSELYPDWASAFQIFDSRLLTAIFPGRLFPFGRALLNLKGRTGFNELADRFTGQELAYSFDTAAEQRFLQLSSTRFVLSPTLLAPPPASNPLIETVLKQNPEPARKQADAFNETKFEIDGDTRFVLFEHPPRSRVPLRIKIPTGSPVFRFSPAISPALFNSKCGDGVGFVLEAAGPDGKIVPLYSRYIDSKHNVAEQHWLNETVDLRPYAGHEMTLFFSTNAGPKGDANCDWAGWGGLELGTSAKLAGDEPALKLVYNAETKIYEFAHPLPRASLFQRVRLVKNEQDALKLIADPAIKITHEAIVVDSHRLTPSEKVLLNSIEQAPPAEALPTEIVNFASQRVTIKSNLGHAGLIMLTDAFFPGWKVYVDDHKRTLLQTDYMFRGVLVEKGSHTVEFRYEDSAVRLGSSISLGGAFAALALWYARKRRALRSL